MPLPPRRTRASAGLAAACLVLATMLCRHLPVIYGAARARTARAQASTQPQFTIQARVPLTIVDVTVTDAKGNSVHGLKQSDFTILENNLEMKPNSFEEHRSDEAPPALTPVKLDLPPNTFTNSTAAQPSDNPLNILLLDNLNTPAQVQQQITQRMLDFVNKMKPGTQAAVFRLTTHLVILQGFTADRDLLKAALTSKSNFAWASPIGDDTGGTTQIEGSHSALQGQYTLSAMRQIARYVSGMPDRKNLIWFSGSFPVQFPPVIDSVAFPATYLPQGVSPDSAPALPQMYDFTEEIKSATDLMASAHLVLYPIDWRGPAQLAVCSKCQSGLTNGGNMLFAERGTMQDMADQTGGKFFYNTNDYAGAVEQAIDNGSNFYTLTYAPNNQTLDTRFRTIKVTVNQPGLHLTYRNGYYAVPPNTLSNGKPIEVVTPMQSALMRGGLPATQILFKVQVAPSASPATIIPAGNEPDPKQMKPPYRRISIAFVIDVHGIQFTPGPDNNYRGSFEYGVRVYNADGDEIVNSVSKTVTPILPPSVYHSMLTGGANAHQEIAIPATGNYYLRVAVHDLTTGHVGSMEIPTSSIKSEPVPAVASGQNP